MTIERVRSFVQCSTTENGRATAAAYVTAAGIWLYLAFDAGLGSRPIDVGAWLYLVVAVVLLVLAYRSGRGSNR